MNKKKGGIRPGAGRPKGSTKLPTKPVRLPLDIADWIKMPQNLATVRQLKNN
jgi:hypothetical protein